jgi:hypothetical protein
MGAQIQRRTRPLLDEGDHDESNGKSILTFFAAQDVAKKLARIESAMAALAVERGKSIDVPPNPLRSVN